MPRNFHVLPREPAKNIPMPPVKPTMGPRPKGGGGNYFRGFWDGDTANDNERDPVWPYYAIGAAVLAMIAVGIFA